MAEEPISLYFDLEPGGIADLEVVAKAALAWSATIKELAYVLDPSLEVRIEVASGTPGSFSLNAVIRSLHERIKEAKDDPVTLKAILIGLAIHFGLGAIDHAYDEFLDHVTGKSEAHASLSSEQMDQLAEKVAKAEGARVARMHAQEVFREAERDPVIRGVGISAVPGERPPVLIPRAEFADRAGHGQIREETVHRRIVPDRIQVILIKPVLVPGNRRWALRSAQGEFGYTFKDTDFVESVLSGTTPIPMVAGIEMDVEVETTEELKDGVWTPIERSVTRVFELRRPPRQGSLVLPPREDNEPDDDDG